MGCGDKFYGFYCQKKGAQWVRSGKDAEVEAKAHSHYLCSFTRTKRIDKTHHARTEKYKNKYKRHFFSGMHLSYLDSERDVGGGKEKKGAQ